MGGYQLRDDEYVILEVDSATKMSPTGAKENESLVLTNFYLRWVIHGVLGAVSKVKKYPLSSVAMVNGQPSVFVENEIVEGREPLCKTTICLNKGTRFVFTASRSVARKWAESISLLLTGRPDLIAVPEVVFKRKGVFGDEVLYLDQGVTKNSSSLPVPQMANGTLPQYRPSMPQPVNAAQLRPQPQSPVGSRYCIACGNPLGPYDRFCQRCGRPILQGAPQPPKLTCNNCHAPVNYGTRYCTKCGAPVVAATHQQPAIANQSQWKATSPAPVTRQVKCKLCGAPISGMAGQKIACPFCDGEQVI